MRLNLKYSFRRNKNPSLFILKGKCGFSVAVNFSNLAFLQNIIQKPVILRKRRQRIKIEANWDLFYYR